MTVLLTLQERGALLARVAPLVLATVVLSSSVACGTTSPSTSRSANGETPADEAYASVVDAVKGDPALPDGIPRDRFDQLARITCNDLNAGGSVQNLIEGASREPTRSGKPMRRESAEALVSAGVRAHCPQHSSQLP